MGCMEENIAEVTREETSIHRYYYSIANMSFELLEIEKGKEYYTIMYSCVYSYYQESLALLRSNRKLMVVIDKQENEFELNYLARRKKVDKALNSADDEDKDFLLYQASN